jgi:hypothetical protein
MLSNLVSASYLTTSSNRQYSPHNHCEYMEMAVAPSAFEAHASRTYVIEENIESGTQNSNSQHHAGMQQTQRPCAPPSLGMLLGVAPRHQRIRGNWSRGNGPNGHFRYTNYNLTRSVGKKIGAVRVSDFGLSYG